MWKMGRRLVAVLVSFAATAAAAQPAAIRATIWDLELGVRARQLTPSTEFMNLACGSNGGPPMAPLSDWTQFGLCEPEADGLHEVYFQYDDAAERQARSRGAWVDPASVGTAEAFFPIMASALFDSNGTLTGLRLVTDPRPRPEARAGEIVLRPRGEHYLLGLYLADRFGITPVDCAAIPPSPGETPVIGQFVKRDCERTDEVAHLHYSISERFLRKPGQRDADPFSGQPTEGQFESVTRAEVRLLPQRSE